MSLLIKGVTKLSQLTIDAAKNWNAKDITNIGSLTAVALHGTTYWGDIFFKDIQCAMCRKGFVEGDKIILVVSGIKDDHIAAIPIHLAHVEGKV